MKEKILLITGFEPFGGERINPSWEAVRMLPDRIGHWILSKQLLPVVFGKAAEIAAARAESLNANAILCIGQAGGRRAVTPEYVAINMRHAQIADNEGTIPREIPVVPGGPDGLFSTVPVLRMAEAIRSEGIEGTVSWSAGTFVCNDTLYSLLWKYRNSNKQIGFIHVPYLQEQAGADQPGMTLEMMCKALTAAISVM